MSQSQKKLTLFIAALLVLQTVITVTAYFGEIGPGGRFGGDFISFWRAAGHVRSGEIGAIYDVEGWRQILSSGKPSELSWFLYPPFLLIALWPLGGLTYSQGVAWWSLVPLAPFLLLLGVVVRRSIPEGGPRLVLTAIALTLPFLAANLFTGQSGTIVAVLFLAAACFLPARPVLAGIMFGLVAIKPQMGLMIPFALAAAGQWRAFAAATGTILALILVSAAWLGWAIWSDYLAMTQLFGWFIGDGYAGLRDLVVGPYVSLQAAGAHPVACAVVQAAVSLTVVAIVVRSFWRADMTDDRQDLRMGILATGTLLATPYALSYDTPMLALAIIPLLTRAWREGWNPIDLSAIVALAVLPFVPSWLIENGIPFGLGALLLTFAALVRGYEVAAMSEKEGGSPGLIRTGGRPINSRMLYR